MSTTTTKHTPGPWHAKRNGEIWNENEVMYKPAKNFSAITPSQTEAANAAMIAAAPELFALVRAWCICDPHGTHADACREAIAKATTI